MSWIQEQEERDYDTQTEWREVMRQEAEDPYLFGVHCEEHDYFFQCDKEVCPQCPPIDLTAPFDPNFLQMNPEDEPPF